MAERVRIEHYEAEDVRAIVSQYFADKNRSDGRGDWLAEDLVNHIGEIYERAMARQIVQAVRSQTR